MKTFYHRLFAYAIILLISPFLWAQGFTEQEISIGELKGTLSIPDEETKAAILLISGSGPTDRDGNSMMGFTNNSLKMVAHSLAGSGYAVLRFDKRGVAASHRAISNPSALRFGDLVEDATNWLKLLAEKDYENFVIAGHSQGSLVGMVAAQGNPDVKGFISLSGLGQDAGTVVLKQLEKQAPVLVPEATGLLDSMKRDLPVKNVHPLLGSLFGPQIWDYFKSYVAYDPRMEIRKLEIPVLIINGTTDIQVEVGQAEALHAASPGSELVIIEGMNHVLKDAPDDQVKNMATYNDPDLPLSDGLMEGILSFISTLKR